MTLLFHLLCHLFREKSGVTFFAGFQFAAFRHLGLQTFGGFTATFGFTGRRKKGDEQEDKKRYDAIVFHVKNRLDGMNSDKGF